MIFDAFMLKPTGLGATGLATLPLGAAGAFAGPLDYGGPRGLAGVLPITGPLALGLGGPRPPDGLLGAFNPGGPRPPDGLLGAFNPGGPRPLGLSTFVTSIATLSESYLVIIGVFTLLSSSVVPASTIWMDGLIKGAYHFR